MASTKRLVKIIKAGVEFIHAKLETRTAVMFGNNTVYEIATINGNEYYKVPNDYQGKPSSNYLLSLEGGLVVAEDGYQNKYYPVVGFVKTDDNLQDQIILKMQGYLWRTWDQGNFGQAMNYSDFAGTTMHDIDVILPKGAVDLKYVGGV